MRNPYILHYYGADITYNWRELIRKQTQLRLLAYRSSGGLLLFALLLAAAASPQDAGLRLLNLERRVDQLQLRLDLMERQQQTQALNQTGAVASNQQALLVELQRQQLSLAQQLFEQQQQSLGLRKTMDQMLARLRTLEQNATNAATPAPKATPTPKPLTPTRKPSNGN